MKTRRPFFHTIDHVYTVNIAAHPPILPEAIIESVMGKVGNDREL